MTDGAFHMTHRQRRGFGRISRAQCLGWVAIALLAGVALLGLGGGGAAFTHQSVGDDAFQITYPVVAGSRVPDEITVTLTAPKAQTVLHFDRAFDEAFAIVSMIPVPLQAFPTSWGTGYRFATPSDGRTRLRIMVMPLAAGQANYTIVADGRMALLSTRILP
ncbi:MAG: hypothetical protein V4712_00275 [Pseudomonadota bacterium]